MKVFVDFHHHALLHSLILLFEKRLGGEVYRAIGPEWYYNSFWKVYDHPATVEQYLGLHQGLKVPTDIHGNLLPVDACVNKQYTIEDGIYYIKDAVYGGFHKAITLDKFKEMKFDILISSMPQHIGPFNSLIGQFQPQAKHIFQVGNAWGHQQGVNNIMASTAPFPIPSGINICFYHQEFNLDLLNYVPPTNTTLTHSYIHYMRQPELMLQYQATLGWQFVPYGAGFPQALHSIQEVADAYKRSAWTWHFKPEGDGFGHCYSQDTEILTDNGWKLFSLLKIGDKVATLNPETGALEYQEPTEYQAFDYQGEMCHFLGQTVDILVTPSHRMWIERYDKDAHSLGWRFEKACEMHYMKPYYPHRAIGLKLATDKWDGEENGITIDWARFLGWYMAEGCLGANTILRKKDGQFIQTSHSVNISNTNIKYLEEIKVILKSLGYKPIISKCKPHKVNKHSFRRKDGSLCPSKACFSLRVNSKKLYKELEKFGLCDKKYIPNKILNSPKNILWAFLEPFFLGDGYTEGVKGFEATMISTNITSKKLIDGLQEIAIKLGLRSHITSKNPSHIGKKLVWRLRITLGLNDKYEHLLSKKKLYNSYKKVSYDGLVYCVTVPNGLVFTRRNGIPVVSGNSLYSSFACGRPPIIYGSFYQGKSAAPLIIDGQTCLDISRHSFQENIALLRMYASNPDLHRQLCENAYKRFKEVVDFDKEEIIIRQFLNNLK